MKNKKFKKGFTIMELLIAVGIAIILIGISLFSFRTIFSVSVESLAQEIAGNMRLAQRLAISNNQRYDVEFVGTNPSDYIEYRIRNYNTGEIYRDEIWSIPYKKVDVSGVIAGASGTTRKFAYYNDGSCQVLDSSDAVVTNGGINVSGTGILSRIRVVETSGRVYVTTTP